MGIAAVYSGPEKKYVYPDLMIRVRTDDDVVTEWIWRVANSYLGRKYMRENATGTAGTMPKINGEVLRNLMVPLPPHSEMIEILRLLLEKLTVMEEFEQQAVWAQREVDALRQSILKAAFEGRLARQDPADEPASVLLARLRANDGGASGVSRRAARRRKGQSPYPSLPGLAEGQGQAAEP